MIKRSQLVPLRWFRLQTEITETERSMKQEYGAEAAGRLAGEAMSHNYKIVYNKHK